MAILKTRLFKPLASDGYIIRSRLINKMNAGLHKPVQKIIGAAGYGKSICVSQWLDEIEYQYCWISLEEDCNDLGVFLNYLLESVRSIHETDMDALEPLFSTLQLPGVKELATLTINGLNQIKGKTIFVLDDYHVIHDREVHQFTTELLNHLPNQHQVILVSRFDPPVDLRRLHAYDKVSEIRMADLMFTPKEIIALSKEQINKAISEETASIIHEKTEGWIIPIRLWLKELTLLKNDEGRELDQHPERSTRLIGDMLEDVFSSLDADIKDYLMLASLFPRFSMELLRGIHATNYPGKEKTFDTKEIALNELLDRSLFIVSLDDGNKWYRFHQLVKEFLVSRSKKNFTSEVISKSIDYGCSFFAARDDIYIAIQLSIQSEDYSKAIELFNKNRYKLLDSQRFDVFRLWIKLFPDAVIETEPSLLLIRAILYDLTKKDGQMSNDLNLAKNLLPTQANASKANSALWGEYYSSSTSLLYRNGEIKKVIEYAGKAMELIRSHCSYLHDHAMSFYILALNASGKREDARAFLDTYKKDLKADEFLFQMNYYTLVAIFEFMEGNPKESMENALNARTMAAKYHNSGILLMSNYYTSVALYQSNELERGLNYLEEALNTKFLTRPTWIIECLYLKCLFYLEMYDGTEYENCFNQLTTFQNQFASRSYKHLINIIRTELYLRRGEVALAWNTYRSIPKKVKSYSYHYYRSELTEVKLLMAEHPSRDLDKAGNLLETYEAFALKTNNRNLYYQTCALQNVLFALNNESQKALDGLKQLLAKTKGQSIIRLYTDIGIPMHDLIKRLSTREKGDGYITEIVRSFNDRSGSNKKSFGQKISQKDTIVPALSKKEIQILQLITDGYQNKEIAEELFYSLGTVKTYIYNIYQKIGAKNRAQAIRLYRDMALKYAGKNEIIT